jgi:hypothetical protein
MAFPIDPDDRLSRLDMFDLKLYERRDALPRAYLAESAVVRDDESAGRRLADPAFDPRAEVALAPSATARGLPAGGPPTPGLQAGPPVFEVSEPERVRLRITATREQYLVLSDSWYPGWRCFVDGIEAPVERANVLFRAVRLDSGEHEVEFRYEPGWFRLGAVVSAISLAVAAVVWAGLALQWSPGPRRVQI